MNLYLRRITYAIKHNFFEDLGHERTEINVEFEVEIPNNKTLYRDSITKNVTGDAKVEFRLVDSPNSPGKLQTGKAKIRTNRRWDLYDQPHLITIILLYETENGDEGIDVESMATSNAADGIIPGGKN